MWQGSLSAWCGLPSARRHFVLNEDYIASFVDTQPLDSQHVSDIHINGDVLKMTLSLWRQGEVGASFQPVPRVCDKSLLSSMIQKAVRRGHDDTAASSALELSHAAPLTLARRLTIIAVEDVSSDANLVAIVWLMLAWSSKPPIVVSQRDVCFMVKYAEALARNPLRVVVDGRAPISTTDKALWEKAQLRRDDVALALILRSTFGGMAGDVRMLLRASESSHVGARMLPFSTKEIPRLRIGDCILAAADFHCEPNMLEEISMSHGVPIHEVRNAIWQNASCLNFRRLTHPSAESKELWRIICTDVEMVQRRRVARAFSFVRSDPPHNK